MVRETRHLWVGNLPDNVSKERIKEYFNRYGPVQSVKPLPAKDGGAGEPPAVTVAFMDIKSACKALQTPHKLDERVLKTDFYDPASGACGSGSCPPTPEEKGGGPGGGGLAQGAPGSGKVDHRAGHFYRGHGGGAEPREYGGGGRHQAGRYEAQEFRHRSRPPYRNGGFNQEGVRTAPGYRSTYGWKDGRPAGREGQYSAAPDKPEPRPALAGKPTPAPQPGNAAQQSKKQKAARARKSKSSDSGSESQHSGSASRSSSSSSSRSSSSASSKSPSPERRVSGGKARGPTGNFLPHTEFDKQCTVVVRNLPERPAEALVKEELAREYKKGGCVVREVRVVDKKRESGTTRHAIITFSDPADVSKALEDSRNKRILGALIDVEKLNSHTEDRPGREGEYSEFHPKATRTLFVGNISREVVPSEIHERFKEFGEILEIDIKKPDYALVQFVDIKSVVKAMRGMSSELIAGQRVRLGFGLSVATKCVWCDGVGAEVTEKMLQVEFSQYGKIQDLIVDRSRGHALVYFDQLKKATIAVKEMRGRTIVGCRLQTDYASHECRAAFFDHCKKSGMDIRERAKPWEQEQEGEKRGERRPRERSSESRGSAGGRGRKRDDYDEELRRFQSERGKFDESERCFTPPYSGARRGVPSTGGPSRSPSPLPRSATARSPGQGSRSGHDRSAVFSDRESVVSDGSRHGSPVSREGWRGPRYKPRVQAISPPGDSRSPADHDDSRRGSKRYREEGEGRRAGRGALPQDPRVDHAPAQDKKHFKPAAVDSGLSEEASSGSSGSVPDVDNAKLPARATAGKALRRTSTDSASASMDGSSRPATPGAPAATSYPAPSLLRVAGQEQEAPAYTAPPRTPVSPPPSSDGSRPGTPLCDENPENLMCRTAAAPVRLASHLRTQNNSSEPMSLPLPRFAQHVLSTSPGPAPRPPALQISPRDPAATPGMLKHPRPDLAKLSILSPTKLPPRPRLKSPPAASPGAPLKSPSSVPGGSKPTFLSPGGSAPAAPALPALQHKPKDPRPGAGLLAVAVPAVAAASPLSPLPRPPRTPQEGEVVTAPAEAKADPSPLELEERLKLLDEKYQSWSSLTRPASLGGREPPGARYNLDIKPAQPSAIVQKLLSRKSVFDEDSKRLENINEKYDGGSEEGAEGSGTPTAPGYLTALKPAAPSPSLSVDSPLSTDSLMAREVPAMMPGSPVKVAAIHRTAMSPRMYLPAVQSPQAMEESSRPLPLPYRAGQGATMGTNPIKPLVDKLSKPAAFTKPSATVTPTLKSTGLTASTSVRSNVFTTTSTKTVSTCTMAPGSLSHPHIGVEKGEASSTTCSPKPDSAAAEVSSSLPAAPPVETDSDPNVTSTTGTEHRKKQEANRDIRTMKKELDSLSSLKEKRDLGEELLFAPSATIMQAKSRHDKKEKKSSTSTHDILKDVKRAKESLHKDKVKSNREKKDKMKVKQKNDLKDFLSATATIRKEAKREKEEKREQDKKLEPKTEDKPMQKRRLSSNSEIEEAEPKSKIPKLKSESECEPEVKKIKTEPMTPMGRIPKLAKPAKEERKERVESLGSRPEASKDRTKSSSSYSKSESSKSKSKHEERHGHKLSSSGAPSADKPEERKKDKHKKKKKEKDKERDKDDKTKKHDKSKSRSHSSEDEHRHKKVKKSKESKKKDEKDRSSSKSDRKDKTKDKEGRDKERKEREKNMSKEDRDKERAKRRHKEMVEEQRKMFAALQKKKREANGGSDNSDGDNSSDEANFSIFDEPVFDENNPIYFSMYDKVKARRSCVKAKEEEEARRQEEALNKFAKLKAQRAKRDGKKASVDDTDSEEDGMHPHHLSSPHLSEDGGLHKKNSSLLNSSSDSEGEAGQVKRERVPKPGNPAVEERRPKPKRAVVDSSEDESPSGLARKLKGPGLGLDSSETEEDDKLKVDTKPKKLHIYSDSDSEHELTDKKAGLVKVGRSCSDSEAQDSKASLLAVIATKKAVKQEVKEEPVSSDGETSNPVKPASEEAAVVVKKEIKTEEGADQKLQHKKKAHVKKEKKREKETKDIGKEKSLLGQKLNKIFGTSSEDEGNCRNSKPPTPSTAKTSASKASKGQKLRVEQVYSDSDSDKRADSPALMSDSDDDVPSRPPTPSFPAAKSGSAANPISPSAKPKETAAAAKAEAEPAVVEEPKAAAAPAEDHQAVFTAESSDEEPKEVDRHRRLSAHDRQKESENLFDSLLTVNVDLPARPPGSWKSPGGSLKSPSVKSPGKSSVSPGKALASPGKASVSPGGTHKSPLVSPGGKPTYLLAHMFGGDRSAREAEKIHRAQEREMHKKGSDRISKETFKTKKDLEDSSTPKKQDDVKPVKSVDDTVVEEKVEQKNPVQVKEKKLDGSKEPKLGQDIEQLKKKPEVKLKDKERSASVSASSNTPKEDVEKEAKAKSNDLAIKAAREEARHRSKTKTEEAATDRKTSREKPKEEKKAAAETPETKAKAKEAPARNLSVGKAKEEEASRKSGKKSVEPKPVETPPTATDSVFDFKDEVEVVEPPREKLKPAADSAKPKFPKTAMEKVPAEVGSQPAAGRSATPDYATFAASTKLEATSSPGPVSEDEDAPLLVIADDNEVQEVMEVKKVQPVIDVEESNDGIPDEDSSTADDKATSTSTAKPVKPEATEQEQLEQSIASILPAAAADPTDPESGSFVTAPVEQKRTVISQEETENAINALLGESFESFEPEPEPVEAARPVEALEATGDDEAAAAVAGLADDEAASAVLGLATDMSEGRPWHKQQEDESIENIAAEIRRSSTDSQRRFSTEAKEAEEVPKAPLPSPPKNAVAESTVAAAKAQEKPEEKPVTPVVKVKATEEKEAARVGGRKLFLGAQEKPGEAKAADVFEFKVEEEPVEPLKAVERPKQPATTEPAAAEVVRSSPEQRLASPPVPARVAPKAAVAPAVVQTSPAAVSQPVPALAAASPLPSPVPTPSAESPVALQRLSTEGKASPPLPLASPNSSKSPKPRMRRSTGGKSRESEEESPDTLQKINLILEQAKQEAERSAHNQQHLASHAMPSLPSLPMAALPAHAMLGQHPSPAPVAAQDLLIDPKTGQVVSRHAAANSVTLTLVTSAAELPPHPSDLRVAVPRTGVPQPTVLPPRHEQQVRPGHQVPRVVAAPPRALVHTPRPPLPIQLPTQPLPPESVRKAQPVLLEQNQPTKVTRMPLPVSLPTEPVPRSVASQLVTTMPRAPLPFSSATMVSSSGALRLVTTSAIAPVSRAATMVSSWQQAAPRPQPALPETGQRVSLNKRDKEPEVEPKQAAEPMKVQTRDYLQPREREVLRPASQPAPAQPAGQQYEVPPAHLASSSQQAQYEAELVRLASYRDLTIIYQQLVSQGHPEAVAQQMAQSVVKERYEGFRGVEEPHRPGSVPPGMALHHMEELRRQQIAPRQPLPAHTPVDYRSESPHAAVYLGNPYSASGGHPGHLESYRRPVAGPEPPAAHSSQQVARPAQSPAVSDYSLSRPASPGPSYNPSVSDYRLPHLAAYPICWSGTLGLKNDMANVRMHYVSGNRDLAKASLPDTGSTLKIVQRMRLEDSQLDGVARKMETRSEHCMLLALPNGSEHEEIELQSKILRSNFITYLQLKSAAGIVNVSNEEQQPAYIVHVFPSCDFANENLARIAPNLLHRVADIEHLVIVIATVFDVNR